MAMTFGCSACGTKLRVADELAGKRSKCPKCGHLQTVPIERPAVEVAENGMSAAGAPARGGRRPFAHRALFWARGLIWAACLMWSVFTVAAYQKLVSTHPDTNAIQHASIATDTAVWLILGYIAARAADGFLRMCQEEYPPVS